MTTIATIQHEHAAIRKWQSAVAEAALPFEARWTLAALKRVDDDIYRRLQDQRSLFDNALVAGTAEDIQLHGAALCRGYAKAIQVLEAAGEPDDAYALGQDLRSGEVNLSRWPFGGRDTCELYKSIDVRRWRREGRLRAGRQFSWSWTSGGEPSGTINVHTEADAVVLIYRVRSFLAEWKSIEQRVSITWTNCHFGGRRPWFTCSAHTNGRYCGRRVAMLYLAGELFACRRCCALAYASQQKDPLVRNVSRSQKIRMRLGSSPDLFSPVPERPRGMWRRTYQRHCAALARIEGNLFG